MDASYECAGAAGGPFLLMSFIKNWKDPRTGAVKWKWIKCRLWFSSLDEIMEFISKYQDVPHYIPPFFDKENFEAWTPYYTAKMDFSK